MRLAWMLLAWMLATPALAAAPIEYDLVANAPLAHTWQGGVVADAASEGFVKYTRDMYGRWKQTTEDGRPVWLSNGVQANIWLPIGAELAGKALALEAVFKPVGKKQRLDAFVNGKKIGSPAVADGWNTLRIELPEGAVEPGFAHVRLHFRRSSAYKGTKTAVGIRAVRIAEASAPALPGDEAALSGLLGRFAGESITLPEGGGLDYYVTPVKGQALTGTVAGGDIKVIARLDKGGEKALGGGTGSLNVSLDAVAGDAVRLMLRGKGTLTGGKIGGGTAGTVTPKKPKYVVFWLIDTLRADKLSFYDVPSANKRPKVKTPNLDALAKEAAVFEPFYVQGNESKASHASLFTGTYPVTHKVYTHTAKLSASHTTLAEAFKKGGFKTAGFCSNGYISDKWNFVQGFDTFVNFIREGKANNAKAVTKAAIKWIDAHKGKPFYLYLGTSDPHVTYRRHKEFIAQYDKGDASYSGRFKKSLSGVEIGKLKGRKRPPGARDRKRIEALYENEIAFNDKHFGRLVEHLKAAGIWDETMVIVSADHGDEFWEHDSCGHGHSLHQELVNVPLMIRYPGVLPAGRVTSGTDGVDLLPTLQALLGQPMAKDVQGTDVLNFVGAQSAYPMAVMASQGTGSFALAVGPAKVIMRSEKSIMAFDIAADPAEKTDVFGTKRVTTLAALDPLAVFLSRKKAWAKSKWGAPNNLTRAFK